MLHAAMRRPARTAVVLAAFAAVGLASVVLGDVAFRHGWSMAPWIAGPGGATPFLVAGLVVWCLLLVPAAKLDGSWTRRFGALCLAGTTAGVIVQLLDDHALNHAGTDNPLGIAFQVVSGLPHGVGPPRSKPSPLSAPSVPRQDGLPSIVERPGDLGTPFTWTEVGNGNDSRPGQRRGVFLGRMPTTDAVRRTLMP